MEDAAQSEKRTRSSKPKVRSGCRTCKNRHLKCDERRPVCLRCEKARMECLGYIDPTKKKKSDARQPDIRRLLPRPARPGTPSSSGSGIPTPPLRESPIPRPGPGPVPAGALFTGQDAVYFEVFRRQLVRDLFHLSSNADFWIRQVLHQTATDSCVRRSVLAIGALAQALHAAAAAAATAADDDHDHHQQHFQHQDDQYHAHHNRHNTQTERSSRTSVSPSPLDSQTILNEHHEAALAHHLEALSSFRKLFADEQSPARASTVLIVTLLFITFELLQGNMPAADNLITTGIILLRDCIKRSRGHDQSHQHQKQLHSSSSSSSSSIEEEADDMELLLPRLAVMSTYSPFCLSQQRKRFSRIATATAAATTPEPRDLAPATELSGDELRSRWGCLFTTSMVFVTRVVGYHLHNVPYDAAAVRQKQADLVRQLDRWRLVIESSTSGLRGGGSASSSSSTSSSYYPGSDPADDPPTRDYLQLVGTHILFCRTFLECCADPSELQYDGFVSVFRELLRRCEVLVASAVAAATATTTTAHGASVGIVPVLLFVAAKCRIRRVRTAALDLLRRLPWRDEDAALWDLRCVIAGHAAQIDLEERGALESGGFIPTSSRFVWSGGTWDDDRCTLRAVYTAAVPNDDGTPHTIELDLRA